MAAAAGIDAKSYALRQAPGLLEFSDNTVDYFRVRRELLEALEKANRARRPGFLGISARRFMKTYNKKTHS